VDELLAYRKLRIQEIRFPIIPWFITLMDGRVVEGGGLETISKEI
jgi:hypothetical protein